MAGVNFEITPHCAADLSYRYMRAEYEFNSGGDDSISQHHRFLLGVNYHFKK
jgi:opacity protein-like surface antigen